MSAAPVVLTHEQRRRILLNEYLALQREQEQKGALPAGRTILWRLRWLFELLAATSLGFLCGSFSVLAVFLFTRVFFHIDLARYLPYFAYFTP